MADIGLDGLTIGERVEKVTKECGYKTEDIAFELDLSSGHIRKLMRGEHPWREDYLEKYDVLKGIKENGAFLLVTNKRRLADSPEAQMELKERIEYDVKSIGNLPPKDRLNYLALLLEKTAELIKKE